jgi:hypothetical protein
MFRSSFVAILREMLYEGCIGETTQPMYRYKTRQSNQCTNIKYKKVLCMYVGLVVVVIYHS